MFILLVDLDEVNILNRNLKKCEILYLIKLKVYVFILVEIGDLW